MTAKLNNFIVLTCLAPNWVRIFAVFLFASSIAIAGEGLPLLRGGKSDYTIVISQGATESEKYAAEEFQRFFAEASGQKLEISSNPGKKENLIFIGNSPELSQVMPELKLILLEAEESVVATKGSSLILAGGPGRGTLYAVYSFLDEFMGCRWYSSDFHHVPKRKELFIPALKVKRNPTFAYREVYIHSAIDPDWAARNRLNSALTPLQEKHGGQVRFGVFVHSFFTFVPPTKFFAEHPEWYSEIEGK
ncbi:MAG: alpha-glucuronidase family glycosyl hydrolase, partial [Verrucomicrobiota bacterium]|nr:alpha-glucuronidase family glycosyl hydrolase [Verrucomicrobiota bacterium]